MDFESDKGVGTAMTIVAIILVAVVASVGTYFITQGGGPVDGEDNMNGDNEPQWTEYPDPNKINLEEETPTIGGVFLGLPNPFGTLNRTAFEWYCGEVLGWNYEVAWPNQDVAQQNDAAEQLIDQGVDALVVNPLTAETNAQIGQMAEEAGIPLVLFGNDMSHPWPLAMFQRNDELSGQACGEFVVSALQEKHGNVEGKILQIHGRRGTSADVLRSSGFHDALRPYRENIQFIEVGNSWSASAEIPAIRSALQANPDVDVVFEEMGGFHSAFINAAEDLGWSEQEIKDTICVNVDAFPVNLDAFEAGTQDYARMMPTGGYMTAPALELLREYWQCSTKEEVEEVIPTIGETYTMEKYAPQLQKNATVGDSGFAPLQWFDDSEYGVVPTDVKPAPAGGEDTPWVLIKDRIIDENNYTEDFIYWNWPVWELSE